MLSTVDPTQVSADTGSGHGVAESRNKSAIKASSSNYTSKMDISGSYTFPASPDKVWTLLMDPKVIASCVPGCDKFEADGEDRYKVTLTVALAAITGSYVGTVSIVDKVEPASYRLLAEGQGKPGFVKGSSAITLRADGDNTIVEVKGDVQTGGPIARVGQRLIGSVSKMMQDRFFGCLKGKL